MAQITKSVEFGMIINDEIFKPQPLTVIFKDDLLKNLECNASFICLQADPFHAAVQGEPEFLKLYEYARKLKDALEKKGDFEVLFKPKRNLTAEEFGILSGEILGDYDASDL